jgi:hypothetical protein
MVAEHQVARGEGDGSGAAIDDKYDGTEYTSKDQRADTWTTFYERDIDSLNVSQRRKKELKRALERQRGLDYGEGTTKDKTRRQRKQQNREEWKRRVVSAYAGTLELTTRQKTRAQRLVIEELELSSFGPYSTEKIALAVCNYVAREEGRWLEDEATFRSLMVDVGIGEEEADMEVMRRLRCMVRERLR